ncbi:MAG TPA: RecX family transcriptional regulator [Candidatus Omnitrophica bacterium]|nr:RecX family transcriptional regulator [Candidatus Omnitrophota bacterium]
MDAFKYASILLKYRPRSYNELVQRLKKRGYPPEEIAETMEKLVRAGVVDDFEFCKYWINYRLNYNPRSKKFLEMELKRKGVDEETILRAFNEFSEFKEQDLLRELAEYKLRLLKGMTDPDTKKRRLYGYLARRGFRYSQIKDVISQIMEDED